MGNPVTSILPIPQSLSPASSPSILHVYGLLWQQRGWMPSWLLQNAELRPSKIQSEAHYQTIQLQQQQQQQCDFSLTSRRSQRQCTAVHHRTINPDQGKTKTSLSATSHTRNSPSSRLRMEILLDGGPPRVQQRRPQYTKKSVLWSKQIMST